MPRTIYKTSDGKRVPGVTTILGRFKDPGGLMYWANQQGLDGYSLNEAREKVATPGTMAHQMVEHHVNGWSEPNFEGELIESVVLATRAFENFLAWQDQTKIVFRHTEHPLVSETYRYGGKFDAVARHPDGSLVMFDFKTGAIYGEHLLQVAAYRLLWQENFPDRPLADGAHLLSFRRAEGDFSHSYFGGLADVEAAWINMVLLYPAVKAIDKRCK